MSTTSGRMKDLVEAQVLILEEIQDEEQRIMRALAVLDPTGIMTIDALKERGLEVWDDVRERYMRNAEGVAEILGIAPEATKPKEKPVTRKKSAPKGKSRLTSQQIRVRILTFATEKDDEFKSTDVLDMLKDENVNRTAVLAQLKVLAEKGFLERYQDNTQVYVYRLTRNETIIAPPKDPAEREQYFEQLATA